MTLLLAGLNVESLPLDCIDFEVFLKNDRKFYGKEV